ncbi:hypothetical protein H257_18750 [Aphanomyces astaci]|uniref:Uncharacterized protein n=1 Tax=Aphanomyces astaci TaxID=112090 RepID=W4FA52_APHAT|nr:hypothetical protein H257_18750 [Aphanomyces astaci]ETV64342.1 hypothetical protein H257_18750 [Aphanomyces astaci]|eukprot:XP_009846173.1 hypothetical protein H257_18750 [Aphanomyces astaci]
MTDSAWKSPSSLGVMVTTGAAFGFAMNKGQVHLPMVIQNQMSMSQFTMMKMFLAALGTSVVSKAIFHALRPKDFEAIQRKRAADPSHAVVLATGGLLLGIGMDISGSCPGSVYVQLGAGIPTALPVFGGVLAGTLLATALAKPMIAQWQANKRRINTTVLLSWPAHALLGVVILGSSVALEFVAPELPLPSSAWLPTLAGIAVGSLQLPLVFILHRSLGATLSYKILLDKIFSPVREVTQFLHLPTISDLSTLVFVVSVVAGSAVATSTPPLPIGSLPSVAASLVGGAFIGVGSTVACGCTSGHGLSGVALLMKSSLIVLPFIFAGGIATGLVRSLLFV